MKVLFIGGTGNISTSVSRLCAERGIDLCHVNRGLREVKIPGVKTIHCDIAEPRNLKSALEQYSWDAVVDWIAYAEPDVERDIELFRGKTEQFIFISSASAYQKPPTVPVITESTPLANPFWEYSRNKIACEERLMRAYREEGFPITIVRPSHTYDTAIPVIIGNSSEYTIIDRMKKGKPVIVHGDGTSLWTLTHSDDFAKGFVGLLGNQRAIGHAFHITSDEILTWNQIHDTMARAAGCEVKILHVPSDFIARCEPSLEGTLLGDKSYCAIFDNAKIRAFVPGFRATIPFSEGFRKTLAWFDADPSRRVVREETNALFEKILKLYAGATATA